MTALSSSYSAEVEMYLILDDKKLSLGQLGPAHCIVEHPVSLPPQDGEIVLLIDGRESRIPVHLPDGIADDNSRVTYQPLVPAPSL